MKRELALSVCLLWIGMVSLALGADFSGTITTMDPQLVKEWWLYHHHFSTWKTHPAIKREPLTGDYVARVMIYFDPREGNLREQLKGWEKVRIFPESYVPPVGSHPWGFYLAQVPLSQLDTLMRLSFVKRVVSAYRPLYPLNDRASAETGALWAREGDLSLRGRGVRLAVLDSGFQLEHPDLPQPAEAMDYADYPDTNGDVRDPISGHGTHVAGTLFGQGVSSQGRWMGMAPNVEPIYFKIGNDTNAWASTAAVVGALKGCITWAHAQIISMSYGGFDGFNDGSSPEEQAVDWVVGQGATVFMSAGNSATAGTHYTASVGGGDTLGPIQVVVKFAGDSIPWSLALSWWDGPDTSVHRELGLTVREGDGRVMDWEAIPQVSSPRGTEYREYLSPDFLPQDSTSYFVYVFNRSNVRQTFHLWILTDHWYVRFTEPSSYGTVLLPSTADSCISVGSYTSRAEWVDYHGEVHNDRTVIGNISYFSSRGPRIDGVLKPNLTAPGQRLISCRDTNNIRLGGGYDPLIVNNRGETGLPADYVVFMGTSMSSPSAAGSAALVMEARPDLNPAQLRQLLYTYARTDQFTGEVPNPVWGWGKIDVRMVLSVPSEPKRLTPMSPILVETFPNPFNHLLKVRVIGTDYQGTVDIVLADPLGRVVWRMENLKIGGKEKVIPLSLDGTLSSGTYWMIVTSPTFSAHRQLVYIR